MKDLMIDPALYFIEEQILAHCVKLKERDLIAKYGVISTAQYSLLIQELGSRIQYIEWSTDDIKLEGVKIYTVAGPIVIFYDNKIDFGKIALFGMPDDGVSSYSVIKNESSVKEIV